MLDKKLSPFDFLNSINEGGKKGQHLLADVRAEGRIEKPSSGSAESSYVPFIINRSLSYFQDTVLFANEVNIHSDLPPRMQYDFLKNCIRPRRRFAKWAKKSDSSADIAVIQKEYNYSREKAEAVISLFSPEALQALHDKHHRGGIVRR